MVLDAMKKDILPRYGEDLESTSEGVIRITASRRKCDVVIRQLELALGNIKRLKLNLLDLRPYLKNTKRPRILEHWINGYFTPESLVELSRLTDTGITQIPDQATSGVNAIKGQVRNQ